MVEVRWEVCDADANPIGELEAAGGRVTFDATARIKRVARGVRVSPASWAEVNPFVDWISPVVTAGDGVPRRMGLFTPIDIPIRYLDVDQPEAIEPYLVDAGWYLYQQSPEPITALAGDRLSSVLDRVAREAGVTRLRVEAGGEVAGFAMTVPPGKTPGEFMDGIATLAGFSSPWFDREGVLIVRPPLELTDIPIVSYAATDVIRRSRVVDQNLLDAPNVYIVQATDATFEPVVGIAEVPSMFPHSVTNRGGRKVVRILSEQGIVSASQAQRLARTAAETAFEAFETVEFSALVNTLHDGYDIVELDGEIYREAGWELELETAVGTQMRHRLQRTDVAAQVL